MSKGDFPEMLSQRILAGIVLVGRLGVIAEENDAPRHTSHDDVQSTWMCNATQCDAM